ncbi:dihydrofolate reductase-like [Uloborus diversus]|uniref:dihydrofolate reductase-like n=1 Tax=Uloborus diversus TaxID=327109 RepID=UPI0024091C20|nr:dihydrofolate reductase-like [Uloborus diversus]
MAKNKPTLNIIAAACQNMGIGNKGALPWRLKKEMNFFKEKTSTTTSPEKQNAVIMGRRTWFSIPEKFRPLSGRINVVLSGRHKTLEGADYVADSLEQAMDWLQSSPTNEKLDKIFVIGGATIYKRTGCPPRSAGRGWSDVQARSVCLQRAELKGALCSPPPPLPHERDDCELGRSVLHLPSDLLLKFLKVFVCLWGSVLGMGYNCNMHHFLKHTFF